jgi:hypothetical protein
MWDGRVETTSTSPHLHLGRVVVNVPKTPD